MIRVQQEDGDSSGYNTVQYSTIHGSRIRVHQYDGGSSRYNTVQYKEYLGLEYTNMMAVPPCTMKYSTRYI